MKGNMLFATFFSRESSCTPLYSSRSEKYLVYNSVTLAIALGRVSNVCLLSAVVRYDQLNSSPLKLAENNTNKV